MLYLKTYIENVINQNSDNFKQGYTRIDGQTAYLVDEEEILCMAFHFAWLNDSLVYNTCNILTEKYGSGIIPLNLRGCIIKYSHLLELISSLTEKDLYNLIELLPNNTFHERVELLAKLLEN